MNPQYVGLAVTPFVGSLPIGPLNPLPVTPGGFPVAVGAQQETLKTGFVAGSNEVIAAVPGKIIFVTGYLFSCTPQKDIQFFTAATPLSAKGYTIVGADEIAGSETYLFKTVAGEALNLVLSALAVNASLQVRYRVEV